MAQTVTNLPAMQETWVQEDPLKTGMATHPSILAWEIPWTEEPGGLRSVGSQRVGHSLATKQKQQQQIIRSAQEPRREEGKHFPFLQFQVLSL